MKNRITVKILSSVLTVLLCFSAIAAILPQKASAAVSTASVSSSSLTKAAVQTIVKTALKYGSSTPVKVNKADVDLSFESLEETLAYELTNGYLDSVSSADSRYTIFVNRYTGVMYYKNNVTGQILSSNPYDPSCGSSDSTARELLSQISISFTPVGENEVEYNSTQWAAEYAQISTAKIENGIRVNYTLGDTTTRFFLPGRITVEDFQNCFLIPMIEEFTEMMKEYCMELVEADTKLDADDLEFLDGRDEETGLSKNGEYNVFIDTYTYEDKTVNIINTNVRSNTRKYVEEGRDPREYKPGLKKYLEDMEAIFEKLKKTEPAKYSSLFSLCTSIRTLIGKYTLINLQQYENVKGKEENYTNCITTYYSNPDLEITATHEPFYECNIDQADTTKVTDARLTSAILSQYVKNYTYSMMYNEERELGYEDKTASKPVFRVALEYGFNADGSLRVSLPANSLSFDESKYTLNSITPLEYFGAGNIKTEGSLFFPDGSGTIIDFDEFSKSTIAIIGSGDVFGNDFTYYTISGAHHEQISMPVYGVTNRIATVSVKDNGFTTEDTMMSGYFAILEEGASLASLTYKTGGSANKYATVYATFNPYPSDTCKLTVTGGTYTIVSDSKYNGSYVTTYKMLTDPTVGLNYSAYLSGAGLNEGEGLQNFYPASYSGMAAFYRDYLVQKGVLTALTDTNENLPLYIEALGSMKIQDKFLTFPITKKIALTTFEDVEMMYGELEAKGITNINFRLTGFANEGMSYTYPVRVKWEKCVGGRRGFRDLLKTANEKTQEAGKTFGVYPEFDFLYIHEQESFDGIKLKGNVARMVDNRYASKHEIDSSSTGDELVSSYTMVITPDRLDALYSKFLKKYKKYDITTLSVASLGSDLNSNFDDDQPVNRDEAQGYVTALLNRMQNEDHYTLMADMGNVYAVQYVTHLLNVSIDSSHFRYSSYTVPFVGMILHGFVNYTGSPINYAGTTEYEFLRAIESGASLYYILCTQNSSEMKDDDELSKYYGVDYATWKDNIVATYNELNGLLKDYQTWNITDHRLVLGERVIEPSETEANYETLKAEFLTMVENQLNAAINEKIEDLRQSGAAAGKIGVTVNETELLDVLADELALEGTERDKVLDAEYLAELSSLVSTFTSEYDGTVEVVAFGAGEFVYDSAYHYITESEATAADYETTDYTSDLNNIVLVTYSNGSESVSFLLNYNIYSVEVRLNGTTYTIPKFGYEKIA